MKGMVPLIGRAAAVAAVTDAWARLCAAPADGPAVVLVTGDAGIGKTRLLDETVANLRPSPSVILRGTARATAPAPYDWTAGALAGTPEPPGLPAGAYARLLQEPDSDAGRFPERALLRVAVRSIRGLVGSGPAILLADDLHWLDVESLTLIGELTAGSGLPAMIAAASRDAGEATFAAPAGRVLSRLAALAGRPGSVRLPLDELSVPAVARLLEAHLGRAVEPPIARAVHRRTGGNPFWISELAVQAPTPEALLDAPLPGHLTALVRSRLAGESATTWTVARTTALLGEQVAWAVLADVAGERDAAEAVPRLVRSGVLQTDELTSLRFPHALAREAIATSALPHEAAAIHRRALEAATRRGDDLAVAHHAHAAGDHEKTLAAARRAAVAQLRAGLPDSAQELARLALSVAPDDPELLDLAGSAALQAGEFDSACQYAEHLLAVAPDRATAAEAHRRLSDLAWRTGRTEAQWRHLDEAEQLAAQLQGTAEGDRELALCLVARSQALMRAERHAEMFEVNDAALVAVDKAGLPALRRALLIDRGTALAWDGRDDAGHALLTQVWRDAEAAQDLPTLVRAVNNLLAVRLHWLPETEAWHLYEAAVASVTAAGMAIHAGKIVRSGVDLALLHGDQGHAHQLISDRLPVEVDPVERLILGAKAAMLGLEQDRVSEADAWYERSRTAISEIDQFWARKYPALLAVAIASRSGTPDTIAAALDAYRASVDTRSHRLRQHRVVDAAIWALTGGADSAAVAEFVQACLPDGFTDRAEEARARCALLEAEGDDAGALRLADDALRSPLAPAHMRAETRTRLARCALRAGDIPAARGHVSVAVELLSRWPGWRRSEAEALLASLPAEMPSLTRREVEVLRLVAQGRSNRQIGRILRISERTVEVHVSRVLTKTGTRSRTEASRWAMDAGILAP